jgi:apolipoprotein N-acyltransferase
VNESKQLQTRRVDWVVILACTMATALLLYFSTGLGDVWAFAWVALVPLLWLAYGRQPLWRVAVAAFVAFGLGNIGFLRPFLGMPAATVGIAVAVVVLSIAGVVAVSFARLVQRRCHSLLALLAFPALWTGIEYLSSLASPNGTVGSLAYTQVGAPVLIQSASLFGIWGITFLICLVSNGAALVLRHPQNSSPIVALVVILFGTNLVFGVVRLNSGAGAAAVHVATIVKDQPADRFARSRATWLHITTDYANEIRDVVAAHPGISTVVLPEKLAVLEPTWRAVVIAPLARAAHENDVRIVAGFDDDASPERNVAITFGPDGSIATYAKRKLLASEEDLTPGTKPGLLGSGMAVEICKDMDFPQMIRSDVAGHDVGVVFVPAEDFTVDGWMHARVAIMRGVEDGFAVVRTARKGDLTISDNRGVVLAQALSTPSKFTASSIRVPTRPMSTVYLAIGDLFAWICLGLSGGVAALSARRSVALLWGTSPRRIRSLARWLVRFASPRLRA